MVTKRNGQSIVLQALVLATMLGLAVPSLAAVPQLVQIEGALTAAGGSPAADGDYDIVFGLYDAAVAGNPLWAEASAKVAVKSGGFQHLLGTQTGLDPKLFATAAEVWLSVTIGDDPALTRQRMVAVPFALRSALAEGLDCSGCVKLEQLDQAVLAPYAKKTDLAKVATTGKYSDLTATPDLTVYAKLASLASVALSGSYADLEGVPSLSEYTKTAALAKVASSGKYADVAGGPAIGTACGTGLVMRGIKADGSYDCVSSAVDAASLPKDGLDEVSNGLLFNQFIELAASTKTPVAIPDNNPVGISDLIDVPDFGDAQALTISAEISNSDTANLKVNLVDPAGGKYALWDKSAKGTVLKTSWPASTKTVSGDLSAWIGKNPKGKWYLEVIDTAFVNNGLDGALKAWSIQVQVLASGKVGVGGGLILKNLLDPPYVCGPSVVGTVYYDTKNDAIRYCSAGGWRGLADTCGNGKVESNEECDDGNNTDSDGCSSNCVASAGFAQAKPGTSCKNVMALAKAESVNTADGLYWLKAGADPAFQAWCDMTRDSGGWTLVFRLAETNWDHNNADNAPPTPTKTKAKFASAVINQISGQKAGNAYELRLEGPVTSTLMQASEPFYVEMNTAQVTVKYDCNRDGTYEKSKTWNSWTVDRGAGEGASWVRDWVFPQNGQCNAWNGGNVMEYWGGTATTPVTSAKPISATAGAYTHDGSIFVWVR